MTSDNEGPSVGYDAGGEGARTMMLVYNLTAHIYQRFAGIGGSAYFIGGFGMTVLGSGEIIVVPIRSGIGCGFESPRGPQRREVSTAMRSPLALCTTAEEFKQADTARINRRGLMAD
jgi:hypothetical protein